jgi:hypothetical protein
MFYILYAIYYMPIYYRLLTLFTYIHTYDTWYIDTPLAAPVLGNPEALQEVLGRTPMGRVGQASEVSV